MAQFLGNKIQLCTKILESQLDQGNELKINHKDANLYKYKRSDAI